MAERRQLGSILSEDFGWPESTIQEALRRQNADERGRRRLGSYLRELSASRADVSSRDLPLALLLQQQADGATAAGAAREFDHVEYQELGVLHRFEREEIGGKIRAYGALVIGLVIYIAYPLNAVLFANHDVVPATTSGLLMLYCLTGVGLVLADLALGDYLVKSYSVFLKRIIRIGKARALIRAAQIHLGAATPTTMPSREARTRHVSAAVIAERPDPEITGLRRSLAFYYCIWGTMKLGAAVYFVAVWNAGSFELAGTRVTLGIAAILPVIVGWFHYAGRLCERYRRTLLEADAICCDNPFPRGTVREWSGHAGYEGTRRGVKGLGWASFGLVLAGMIWQCFLVPSPHPLVVAIMGAIALLHLLGTLLWVHYRLAHLEFSQALAPRTS